MGTIFSEFKHDVREHDREGYWLNEDMVQVLRVGELNQNILDCWDLTTPMVEIGLSTCFQFISSSILEQDNKKFSENIKLRKKNTAIYSKCLSIYVN